MEGSHEISRLHTHNESKVPRKRLTITRLPSQLHIVGHLCSRNGQIIFNELQILDYSSPASHTMKNVERDTSRIREIGHVALVARNSALSIIASVH